MRTMILLSPDELKELLEEYGLWDKIFYWNHEIQIESVLRKMCEVVKDYADTAEHVEKCLDNINKAINLLIPEIGDGTADSIDLAIKYLKDICGLLMRASALLND